VRYRDPEDRFEAAIYVNHLSPCFGALLIEKYFAFDPRVKLMAKFVLHWARIKGILGPARGFLSSYGLLLLIIFFLQIQQEPVTDSIQLYSFGKAAKMQSIEIPSFHELLKRPAAGPESQKYRPEHLHMETVNVNFLQVDVGVMKRDLHYPKNTETVGELLTKFFYYFGIDYPVRLQDKG
jgi:DNA polymerase sigma